MSLNKKRIAGHIGLFCGLLEILWLPPLIPVITMVGRMG